MYVQLKQWCINVPVYSYLYLANSIITCGHSQGFYVSVEVSFQRAFQLYDSITRPFVE